MRIELLRFPNARRRRLGLQLGRWRLTFWLTHLARPRFRSTARHAGTFQLWPLGGTYLRVGWERPSRLDRLFASKRFWKYFWFGAFLTLCYWFGRFLAWRWGIPL
jgi:hypothetical protein